MAIVDTDSFISTYWRKKPCLLRQLVPSTSTSTSTSTGALSVSALLALTDQDVVESRFIDDNYRLQLGPLHVQEMPRSGMVMINGLDQHLQSVDALLQRSFGFLPRWRIDDVMASLGGPGSNCGAHFDHYDVFLVQDMGTKTWQLDAGNHSEDELRTDTDIRLLNSFEATAEYQVTPGDVLYIPPGVGHYGVNDSDSITLSIGIRNPTMTELVSELADFVTMRDDHNETVDDYLQPTDTGIRSNDISLLRERVSALLGDESLLADWYGEYSTRLREPDLIRPLDEVHEDRTVQLHPYTRMTWYESDNELRLYVNGEVYTTTPSETDWLKRLCIDRSCPASHVPAAKMALIKTLARHGALVFSDLVLESAKLV